jgi:predicted aspartyl protease
MTKKAVLPKPSGAAAMGRFSVEFEVANFGDILQHRQGKLAPEKIRRLSLQGVVDPGATTLVLPDAVAHQLGLTAIGKVRVRYADKRSALRDEVDSVYTIIQGRSSHFKAILEKKRSTALIGAIVLETLDFLVDCGKQRLVPRDPKYVVSEIE